MWGKRVANKDGDSKKPFTPISGRSGYNKCSEFHEVRTSGPKRVGSPFFKGKETGAGGPGRACKCTLGWKFARSPLGGLRGQYVGPGVIQNGDPALTQAALLIPWTS